MPVRRVLRSIELALATAALLSACSSDSSTGPVNPSGGSITVDASSAPAYVALGDTATQVTVASPTTSTAWDMSFLATTVTTNGGAAGPGGVSVFCMCQNASATTAQVQAMTAANQQATFDAVTASDIPAAAMFQADALDPVINGWYDGAGAAATPTAGRSWILRKTVGAAVILAKFRVTALIGPSATTPGQVVVEYAIEAAEGAAFGPTETDTVTVTAGAPAYLDMTSGGPGSAASWDVAFQGWNILSNGGVSGSGTVKGVVDNATAFAAIDVPYAQTVPPQAYRADLFSGAFANSPWYRYNITGADNQIWPLFNVYLVRRGTAVYKVQLTGYYSAAGAPRNITVRYAHLAG
jgi:hypothetical protein